MLPLALPAFDALVTGLGAALPSGTAIVQQIALGAASNVLISGLTQQMQNLPDPLGLRPKAPAASPNSPAASAGPTITATAYAALPAVTQAQLTAAGVHIIAG